MDQAAVDRVLSCRTLPSLLGVALEVLALTRDPRVPIDKLAKVVQNDPALTAKILRTVNSSYYGLTNPCPTISRAVSLLGLNTVKSLVLGFSLVEMTGRGEKKGFDLAAYWRRTIYSAAAARLVARRTRTGDPEEAFIGALLQDVGMLAAHGALGQKYTDVLQKAPEDHQQLPALESAALGFNHAEVGSLLAEKWKLPPQVVESTRRHHQPDLSAIEHARLVRLVALGTDAAGALTLSAPRAKLGEYIARAAEWFSIERPESEEMLKEIAEGASQLSSLLEIKTGQTPDVAALLADANEQLTLHQIEVEQVSNTLQQSNRELTRQNATDALTGASNRKHFDSESARCFANARESGEPLAVLFVDADRFKSVNDTHGHQTGDAVLIEIARRLGDTTGPKGIVFRYGGEEFAILLPGSTTDQARDLAEQARRAIEARPIDVRALRPATPELKVTVSIGVAATDKTRTQTSEQLVHAADQAVYAAKNAGRNCVRVAGSAAPVTLPTPAPAGASPTGAPPAGPGPMTVLIVDGDPLAAKLLELMCSKRCDARVRAVGSAEEALRAAGSGPLRPSVVICDLRLPGMPGIELIRRLRADPTCAGIAIVAMSASADESESAACLQAGADLFVTKAQVCGNFPKWVATIVELGAAPRRAA